VLGQCTALAHLNLSGNLIAAVGEGGLRASWCGQASGLVFEDESDEDEEDDEEGEEEDDGLDEDEDEEEV
jgi:hypothetical protein